MAGEKKKELKKPAAKGKDAKFKEEIQDLKEQLAEAEEKILRLHAEYDNYRKRSYRELTDARTSAKVDTLIPILNVFDHFKMAVDAADQTEDMNVIKEGMNMICNEFSRAMEEYGLQEINAVGEKFDPNMHEAVAKENSPEEEDTVIKQWKCGYKIGDKLLRPATVVVSNGPEGGDD